VSDGEAGPAITRFDFTRGRLRGSHFVLYANCLVHRGEQHLETVPLAAIASLRVAYERDPRKLGWGISLLIIAALVFAISGPLASLAGEAAQEMAAAGTHGVARALHGVFSFFGALASTLPFLAAAGALAGVALAVVGWLGSTTLVLDLAGSQRTYPVMGRNAGLLDFSEAVCERLMSLKR
jgi:hypothetical protein